MTLTRLSFEKGCAWLEGIDCRSKLMEDPFENVLLYHNIIKQDGRPEPSKQHQDISYERAFILTQISCTRSCLRHRSVNCCFEILPFSLEVFRSTVERPARDWSSACAKHLITLSAISKSNRVVIQGYICSTGPLSSEIASARLSLE